MKMMKGRQKAKKLYLLALTFLLLFVVAPTLGFVAYQTYGNYHADMALAQEGMHHLQTAAYFLETLPSHSLGTDVVDHAQREFGAALTTFSTLNTNLEAFPGISTSVPDYGPRLRAAMYLSSAAANISRAGSVGCTLLHVLLTKLHDPLKTTGHGLSMADITSIDQDFQQVKTSLDLAIDEAEQVQPGDLQFDPRIESMLVSFQKEIPTLQALLGAGEKLVPVLPALLGVSAPANYLIEVLDSTELRPGGGFIGNYGIATFTGGSLIGAQIRDVVLLDAPFEQNGHHIPYPQNYTWFGKYLASSGWSFRDSNLDADFPTAARNGELNYTREGGNVPVQGVIAITPALIQHMLEITGPIRVPEYNEIVTSQNLVALIHYYQLSGAYKGSSNIPSSDGYSSTRKHFVALLAQQLVAGVRKLSPSAQPKLFQLLLNSLYTKDIQVYFNASSAENLLQSLHLDGAIQAFTGDSLFIVDTNVAADKANSFIVNTVNDNVTIDGEGNATHHSTLNYAWTVAGRDYGNPLYKDYVRIYVPPGSILQSQNGWQPYGTGEAFGREVWNGFFTLTRGQTRTITLTWAVPHAATKQGSDWHYDDLVQRQAGTQWTLHVQVKLPSCAAVSKTWGGMVVTSRTSTMLVHPLNEDTNSGVNYTC